MKNGDIAYTLINALILRFYIRDDNRFWVRRCTGNKNALWRGSEDGIDKADTGNKASDIKTTYTSM